MLSRLLSKPSSLRFITLISSSQSHYHPPLIQNPTSSTFFPITSRFFPSNRGNSNDNGSKSSDFWKISTQDEETIESVFGQDTESLEGIGGGEAVRKRKEEEERSWFSSESKEKGGNDVEHDIFKAMESESKGTEASGVNDKSETGEGFKDWNFVEGDQKDGGVDEIFDIGDAGVAELGGLDGDVKEESQKKQEEDRLLEIEEKALTEVLKD